MRPATKLARTGTASLTLIALIAVPPFLLWTLRSTFLPDHLPTGQELLDWFTERDSGHVFLGLLVLIGLIAWLQLVVAVLLEAIAALRGVSVPRVRGFGWAQKLVAGLLLTLLASTATAAETIPHTSASHLLSTTPPTTASPTGAAPAEPATSKAPKPSTHTVAPGESLMSIAADQLGDENRYREIFDLNKDRRQPDGAALRDVGLIKPGWKLLLPENEACDEVCVRQGDTLSKIARDHLGDARRYPEIFALNKGRQQPGGAPLTTPNHIYPGTVLRLPSTGPRPAGGSASQSASRTNADPIAGGTPPLIPSCAAPTPVAQDQPAKPDSPSESNPIPAAPSRSATPVPAAPTAHRAPAAEVDDGSPMSLIGFSVGGLLAAGLLATLGTRRMRAQRRRRPGHRIHTNLPGDFETALRVAEQPATVDDLDTTLRTLAHHVHQAGQALPAIRAVTVGASGVVLHPQEPGKPPSPLVALREAPGAWAFDPAAEAVDLDFLRTVPPPYPALISLGHDQHRNLILLNLEQVGAITLTGNTDDMEAVLLAMAWDLAASSWADHLVATLIGFGQTTAAHNPGRLRYAATIDDALDTFERRAQDVREGLQAADTCSIDQARGLGLAEDTWSPEIILSAAPFNRSQQDRLCNLVSFDRPTSSLAAVITAAEVADDLPGAWHFDLGTKRTRIEPLGLEVDLQRLSPAQDRELVAALASADNAINVPVENFRNIPPEPDALPVPLDPDELEVEPEDSEIEQACSDVPEVRVLGPVVLANVDPDHVEAKKFNRLTELAAFLALHSGVTADEISRQMGTGAQPWSASTRQGYISRLRTWLGRDHDGELYLPNVDIKRGGYRLSESVRCDWHRFESLVQEGLSQAPADGLPYLKQALSLVTGMPFSSIPHGRYVWSSWIQREMTDAIVDVAHAIADASQKTGSLAAARKALARGLQADPASEILYRDLLRVEHQAGNLAGVKETADKLAGLAADLDVDLDEETSELVHKLLDLRYRASLRTPV
ncbi:LysM domain-containing protein [Amycolatopsis xylanica]|uniref:LysM domain-containing protein n=1 Tax=Amycolatopsis xylanica TaxID=589385 RepID=A0A1H3S3A2_9PSEU|nr:BTAD domain-containing putative transcriptional regulator [Amycolatopsis xylanica]SDZ32402.1 LysM domain-containing protein [Amycolatopsis xylanica]